MEEVYLSLGSNIGDRIKNIEKAIKEISKISKIKKLSNLYITEPMYFKNQPYFINCVIKINTKYKPQELIEKLLLIEKKLGRKRIFKNGPRIIDIDIIYYGNRKINEKKLIIPHPKRLERAFVLKPILDIDPKIKDKLTKKNLCDILKGLNQKIIRIPKDYNESLVFLKELKPRERNDFTTKYIKKTLKKIGDPQKKLNRVIHITGSVGKTSTALYISRILNKIGFSTSTYISPHINELRERITINNNKIPKKEFYKSLKNIISKAPQIHSVFEYLTLIALNFFSEKKTDYVIIEVGMGGLNDATNVFEKTNQVFTLITKEHKKFLGKTIVEIAKNKSGIIKQKSKVFISSLNKPKVVKIILKKANSLNSKTFISPKFKTNDNERYNFLFSKWVVENLINTKIDLDFFKLNLPARNQIIKYKKRYIIIDGAHTLVSIKKLLKNINEKKYKICLCSFMKDKDYAKCINEIIQKEFQKIIITKSFSPRSFEPNKLRIKDNRILIENNLKRAFYKGLSLGNMLICGSLYLASDINSIIRKEKNIHLPELI